MKVLVVVPPYLGHVGPTVGVAEELVRRGHQVSWVGDPDVLTAALPEWADVRPCRVELPERPPGLRGFGALKFLWERVLVPLADAMAPAVADAIDRTGADIVLADQQAFAGALTAERHNIPWVTSATTSGEFATPIAPVRSWVDSQLDGLRARHGGTGDPRFSDRLILAFTSAELVGARQDLPIRFVGAIPHRTDRRVAFPWDWCDPDRRLVLVTLGTVNADAGAGFLRAATQALAERAHLQAVVVDPKGTLNRLPDNVIAPREIPQQAVLDQASAVVCHAGHNTVCEALGRGLPLVVAPIRDDQPVVADQVVRAGAGLRLRFDHAKAGHVGDAVDSVLRDPAYRAGADRISESFRRAGGAVAAVDALEGCRNS